MSGPGGGAMFNWLTDGGGPAASAGNVSTKPYDYNGSTYGL